MDDPQDWLSKAPLLAALVGGVLDYFRQVQTGERAWSFWQFCLHLGMAIFFGWLCGVIAGGLGYSGGLALGAAGFGGFLGVRVADFIYLVAGKRERA
jgi:hypothetical protein